MSFLSTLKEILPLLPMDKAGELIGSLKNDNELIGQVAAMLNNVRQNPESASQIATAIISMRGVPGAVRDMVGALPKAAEARATDNGLMLEMMISSINQAMTQRRGWFA